jgi:hypothetical protein
MAIDHVLSLYAPQTAETQAALLEALSFAEAVEATNLQSTADLIDLESAAAFERTAIEAAA